MSLFIKFIDDLIFILHKYIDDIPRKDNSEKGYELQNLYKLMEKHKEYVIESFKDNGSDGIFITDDNGYGRITHTISLGKFNDTKYLFLVVNNAGTTLELFLNDTPDRYGDPGNKIYDYKGKSSLIVSDSGFIVNTLNISK